MNHPSRERRQELCAADVTLNGRPALVAGWQKPFAKVFDLATGLSAEWAWATVDHIVTNREGRFQT